MSDGQANQCARRRMSCQVVVSPLLLNYGRCRGLLIVAPARPNACIPEQLQLNLHSDGVQNAASQATQGESGQLCLGPSSLLECRHNYSAGGRFQYERRSMCGADISGQIDRISWLGKVVGRGGCPAAAAVCAVNLLPLFLLQLLCVNGSVWS